MQTEAEYYKAALHDLRSKLEKRRGYASRVAAAIAPKLLTPRELNKKKREVYNVAHGRIKNPDILQALINEAEEAKAYTDPSVEILSKYLNNTGKAELEKELLGEVGGGVK